MFKRSTLGVACLIFVSLNGCNSSGPTSSDAFVTTEPGVEPSTKTPPGPPAEPTKPVP